ncbi:MAG: hypothetical protein ACK5PI_08125 [Acetobacteraceae bacterium]
MSFVNSVLRMLESAEPVERSRQIETMLNAVELVHALLDKHPPGTVHSITLLPVGKRELSSFCLAALVVAYSAPDREERARLSARAAVAFECLAWFQEFSQHSDTASLMLSAEREFEQRQQDVMDLREGKA